MKTQEFIENLKPDWRVLKVLSQKNGCLIALMRNEALSRDMVLRKYSEPVLAYSALLPITNRNLPEVYDSLILEDGQIVLEEFVGGMTVAEILEKGTYTYRGARAVLRGVCSALKTLHDLRFVHRDIKPENIIISDSGEVKLIDLNASRRICREKSRDTVQLGTIGYAPPEQFGLSQSDERADIYSLGVLFNEMLTGDHPSSALAKGKAGKIVLKATSIDPENRYRSIEKFVSSL